MEIRQIQYFLSIVETGSFSAAADELYISQSSLSKMVIALEKELSVTLFDRSRRKVSLTRGGEAFLDHARRINAAYKAMLFDMNEHRSSMNAFTIGTIPVLTQYGINAWISQYKDTHPEVRFDLEEIDGQNILPALSEKRFDIVFTRHNYLDPEKFESLLISKDKLLVVVSRKNRHAGRSSLALSELSGDNFIVFDKVTEMYRLIMDECARAGFEPTVFYSSHRKVSVVGLVGTNIGLALMPSKVYEYHQNPDVLAIPLEQDIACNIVLAYPKDRKLPEAACNFIEYLKTRNETTSETLV
jgi:DNA-binding transcriptional LysR family regulator